MMNDFEQQPFTVDEFVDNPDPRCPCVLLLDVSGSMRGEPLRQLNEGLRIFKDELSADSLAARRVEIAIVTFGPVTVVTDFVTADQYQPSELVAQGDTPMGAAIERGLDLLDARKQQYKTGGVQYYRPWVFLITDGGPTDHWKTAADRIRAKEAEKGVSFFAVGVEGARFDILGQISVREPLKLKELRFRDLFVWLSSSLSRVSQSQVGEKVSMDNPASPNGWASV
jgi:uncharacterized protein YegL